jgi:hypothetical protein
MSNEELEWQGTVVDFQHNADTNKYRYRWRYDENDAPQGVCYDCRIKYHHFPDMHLPNEAWFAISPAHEPAGGLLCPTCMANRLQYLNLWYPTGFFILKEGVVGKSEATPPADEVPHLTFVEWLKKAGIKFDPSHETIIMLDNSELSVLDANNQQIRLQAPDGTLFTMLCDHTGVFHVTVEQYQGKLDWNVLEVSEKTLEQCLTQIEWDKWGVVGKSEAASPADDIPYLLPFLDREAVQESYPYKLLLKQKEVLEQQTEELVKIILLVYQNNGSTYINFGFFDTSIDCRRTLVAIEFNPTYPLTVHDYHSEPEEGEKIVNSEKELREAVKLVLSGCIDSYWRNYKQIKESYESRK